MVRDYRYVNKGSWAAAIIRKKLGRMTYLCEIVYNGRMWKIHSNQISWFGSSVSGLDKKVRHNNKEVVIECVSEDDDISDSVNTSE